MVVFIYFNQLVIFKPLETLHKDPGFWLFFKKVKYVETLSRPLFADASRFSHVAPYTNAFPAYGRGFESIFQFIPLNIGVVSFPNGDGSLMLPYLMERYGSGRNANEGNNSHTLKGVKLVQEFQNATLPLLRST